MKTALDARHRALGARMIPFAGWDMPVQYRGLVEEHNAVRTAAGLFDLSHMGEIFVTGPDAAAALDYALVTAPGKLAVGRAHYSMICDEGGGVIDDLIVYRLGDTRYMVVPNASNAATVATANECAWRRRRYRAMVGRRILVAGTGSGWKFTRASRRV